MSEDAQYFPSPKLFVPAGTLLDTQPGVVDGVAAAFETLRTRPERLGSWDMDKFPNPAYMFQNVGGGETQSHFQGIQRLEKHNLLVISGGDLKHKVSHLFLVECDPRSTWGPLGSNLWKSPRTPPDGDRLRRVFAIDRDGWHAGGISVLGDIIAVPLEGPVPAHVVFLDLSDPMAPRWIGSAAGDGTPNMITVETRAAGAIALTRTPGGHFLAAIWRDEQGSEAAGRIDFFVSKGAVTPGDRQTAFEPDWKPFGAWVYAPPNPEMPAKPHYQALTFIWERGTAAPSLFLIGTRNSDVMAPNQAGEDWADLYQIAPPAGMSVTTTAATAASPAAPTPVFVAARRFRGADEFCSFAGAGGAFVSAAGGLAIYAAFHFRGDGLFRMSEYWGDGAAAGTWWVDLFERSNFEGHRLAIFDPAESTIDDYGNRFAQGDKFDDTVISVRHCLPVGVTYRLFKQPNHPSNPAPSEFVDLLGTGAVVEVPRLDGINPAFGRTVRSSALVP
ncbi:MAG: hypothetical protein ABI647_18380 [Gemmatimonadota bacterium]